MDNLLSAQQLADLAGVTAAAITQARQAGRIEGIQQGRNWFYSPQMATRLNQSRSGNMDSLSERLLRAKVARENALAGIAELELGERDGTLVNQEKVILQWQHKLSNFRTKILAMPTKLALELSGIKDQHRIEMRLIEEFEQALAELTAADDEAINQAW